MTYHFSKMVNLSFDAAVAATTEALKRHGFGVLTQIDVKDTLQKKMASISGPISSSEHATQRWHMKH